jgi:hypothetical protein
MRIFSLIFLFSLLFSCKQIIEKDISGETPVVILPQINDTIEANPVHFKWKDMEGATKYHLEIVSPSFTNISTYNLDSIVTGTNFYLALDSNQYEFRITALNAGDPSKTTAPICFVVGTSVGVSPTGVVLDSPPQFEYYNAQFNGVFSWFTLPNTVSYTFELHEGTSFAGPTLHFIDQIGTNSITSFTGSQLGEGVYTWGVKSFLSNGDETLYSKRTFYIDTISPGDASLSTPVNNSFESAGNITFSWTLPADIGVIQSPVKSILQISTNTTFTSLLAPDILTGNSITKNMSAGTYYWRVKTEDESGNLGSVPSSYYTLTVL